MGLLVDTGVLDVSHYTPLHYLPFIVRTRSLMSKRSLRENGYAPSHFRSSSHRQDVDRGFDDYVHLTLEQEPNILKAKLAAGFPHIAFCVSAAFVDTVETSLCRSNVAKTRNLRRDGMPGYPANDRNGQYYGEHQIPIARSAREKVAMLTHPQNKQTMIEVLVHGALTLPGSTKLVCYSAEDAAIVSDVLSQLLCGWHMEVDPAPPFYPRSAIHVRAVADFLARALNEPDWHGRGLKFDRPN